VFLGGLGVHKFVLGYTKEGLIMLLVTLLGLVFTAGLGGLVMWTFGFIEGVIYLTKSHEKFNQTYVSSKKPWF
jgi:TM2 domain-containing membrane protein YozV